MPPINNSQTIAPGSSPASATTLTLGVTHALCGRPTTRQSKRQQQYLQNYSARCTSLVLRQMEQLVRRDSRRVARLGKKERLAVLPTTMNNSCSQMAGTAAAPTTINGNSLWASLVPSRRKGSLNVQWRPSSRLRAAQRRRRPYRRPGLVDVDSRDVRSNEFSLGLSSSRPTNSPPTRSISTLTSGVLRSGWTVKTGQRQPMKERCR
jgi:hypothetical protein